MTELEIRQKVFMIHADISHGIKPRSNEVARLGLKRAFTWAIRNRKKDLAKEILAYLNHVAPELKPAFQPAMPIQQAG